MFLHWNVARSTENSVAPHFEARTFSTSTVHRGTVEAA
jgi:hypothetical protein